jgi:hypothetical protein
LVSVRSLTLLCLAIYKLCKKQMQKYSKTCLRTYLTVRREEA